MELIADRDARMRVVDAIRTLRGERDLDAYVIAANISEGIQPTDMILRAFRRRDAAMKRLRAALQ